MRTCRHIWITLLLLAACQAPEQRLPVLGEPVVTERFHNGATVHDTTYPVIPPFVFTDQDSLPVSEKSFAGHIYVTDFIFLSCPAICPKMTAQLKKVYQAFEKDDRILFLSHTIDPERDTVARLKAYTTALGVNDKKWRFVTGNQDSIYHLAEKSYFSAAYKDSTADGGYVHGGGLLLVDRNRHIRGVYSGTDTTETTRLIKDIHRLLKEPS